MPVFRCFHCHRKSEKPRAEVGRRFACSGCGETIRVPRKDFGNSRVRSWPQWLFETILYGIGGAVLAFGLVLVLGFFTREIVFHFFLVPYVVAAGFVFGAVGGLPALEWIGRQIREREIP